MELVFGIICIPLGTLMLYKGVKFFYKEDGYPHLSLGLIMIGGGIFISGFFLMYNFCN
jgi:hypothetical protein